MSKLLAAVAVALCAAGCSAQGAKPAASPAAQPVAASPAAKPAAASPAAPAAPAAAPGADGTPHPAAAGVAGSPPDEWTQQAAGEVIATVPMRLVTGLEAVDMQPRTLQGGLGDSAPADVDATALPAGGWQFGAIPVTKTESIPFAVAPDREWLVFDADRDGMLAPHERVARADSWGGVAWFDAVAPVRQTIDGKVMEMAIPQRVGVMLGGPRSMSRLNAYREGTATIGGRQVRLAIVDQTFRGWFSHPSIDALVVDVDGDGRFDNSAESFERYRLGEPFPVGDADVVIKSVGPFGSTITLARSTTPAMRKSSLHVGSKAPVFKATTVDGKPVDLAALKGKWVLLDFWATWCGPCRNELPNLKSLRQAHPDVVILGLSGDDKPEPVAQFAKAQGMDWPQIHAQSRAVMQQYRVVSFPTSFLVAPDGTIATRDLRGPGLVAEIGRLKASFKK